MIKKLIIAIDGHSSCGKSTFAKAIATRMNYLYLDSGAMYRAVTLACMEEGVVREGRLEEKALPRLLEKTEISFRRKEGSADTETFLNGVNVEEKIRSIEVASNVSLVSKSAEVRKKMVSLQREMGKSKGIVMDGRDIGTVVFPGADIKIFLTAGIDIRAERRYKELVSKGQKVRLEEIRHNIAERDRIDENRDESPLKKAPDAIVLDNSYMTPGEQMIWFENLLAEKYIRLENTDEAPISLRQTK
ncbi:MAG: (d)CMP kinase [Bacteroidales bacterium]